MASSVQGSRTDTTRPRQPSGSRATQRHADPPETEAGPRVGSWGRFGALPPHQRRALIVCMAWLIGGYCGLVLFVAGVDDLLGTSHRLPGLILIVFGAALAVTGFARGRKRIADENEWPP
jgi:predicted MFS family arabinose efflux permease